MVNHIRDPNVFSLTSSRKGENSYALHGDAVVGVSTIDRFTAATVNFLARAPLGSSLGDLVASLHPHHLHSHPTVRYRNASKGSGASVSLAGFFGAPARHVVRSPAEGGHRQQHEAPLALNVRARGLGMQRETMVRRRKRSGPVSVAAVHREVARRVTQRSLLGFVYLAVACASVCTLVLVMAQAKG